MGQKLAKATDTPKKRILVVTQHFWPESFRINDICDFLTEDKNCEIDVLCGIPNYPKGEFFKGYSYFSNRNEVRKGVNIKRVPEIPRGGNSTFRIFINYISFPVFSLFYIPWLLTKKYDKILLYQLSPVMMSFAGIVVGKIKKIETTMYVLDLWPENLFSVLNIQNKFLRKLVTYISHWHYKRADKLIALSEQMKDQLLHVTHKHRDKIITLPQVAEKLYETPIHDSDLEKRFGDTFNVVFTGNISPAQSFQTMIDAADLLKKQGVSDIRWIIIGDGMSRKDVENTINERGLSDQFIFEGYKLITDIPRYTAISDILVGCLVKSDLLEATIPAKVMSYIASAKPIVLAMDGEAQELINATIKCGYAGPTEDSAALATNIKKLHDLSLESRTQMGERARIYHGRHFERNIVLNKLHRFIFSKPTL